MDTIAAYTGWGAFGQELFNGTWDKPAPKKGWEEEDEWLRAHLGEAEWKSAQESIINAHYTDPEVVTGMWDMLRRMGFDGGRVLEPSIGVGNFFSLMPRDLMDKSILTGIELDKLTSDMVSILHPNANIWNYGYQDSKTPDNFYDVILSNVPFANVPVPDRRYRTDFSVHNYFFRKAIDQLKPGGLIAFITSNTTMDGKTQARLLRSQLDNVADLVTAIRFPSGAFQRYAGTKVVADLIVLRKRKEGEPQKDNGWKDIVDYETPSGQSVPINQYWLDHPENILGTLDFGNGTTTGRPGMIVKQPSDLASLWDKAIKSVPTDIFNTVKAPSQGKERANRTNKRQNSILREAGDLYIVKGEQLLPLHDYVKWYRKGSKAETIQKMQQEIEAALDVRDALSKVLDKQSNNEDATAERKSLNKAYDDFVSKYGYMQESKGVGYIRAAGDPLGAALYSLERDNRDGTYSKRPIFTKATVRQKLAIENPTIEDAFVLERNESLDIDMDRIAQRAKVSKQEAIDKLIANKSIYKTGDDLYDAADIFLSGNIARKIRSLEAAKAEGVDGLEDSLVALRERLPEPVAYSQIDANLGAPWVDSRDYQNFLSSLLNEPPELLQVERRPNGWKVRIPTDINNKPEAQTIHGHRSVPFSRLVASAMNNGTVTVRMPDPQDDTGKRTIVDEVATAEANGKIGELRDKFKSWLWADQERISRLSKVYNEEFNSSITPSFDDVPLRFEGMALQRGEDPVFVAQASRVCCVAWYCFGQRFIRTRSRYWQEFDYGCVGNGV